MAGKRSYHDVCGTARALDVIGERWSLMVVRELLLGPKRFTDLREGLPHVSPDVLAQRLRDLAAAGVLRKTELPPPAAAKVYELTDHGRGLEPVIAALGRWGATLPVCEGEEWMSFDAHLISFRTMFSAEAAGDLEARVELDFEGRRYHATVADGGFELSEGPDADAEATISGPIGTVLAAGQGRLDLDRARAEGLEIDGDAAVAERFLTLFPLPDPAPLPTA